MTAIDDRDPLLPLLGTALAGRPVDLAGFPGGRVVAAALAHGVAPLLRERANEGVVTGLDTDARAQIDRITQSLVAFELLFDESARRLTALLADSGFDHLFMKGTALAELHYDQPWHRPRSDVDVWIREDEAAAIGQRLTEEGYRVVNLRRNPRSSRQFQASRVSFQGVEVWADVHLKPSNRALFYDRLDFDACLAEAQRFGDAGAPALSDRHLLLHGAMHRITHGRNTEKQRLVWLWDLHRLFLALGGANGALEGGEESDAPEGSTGAKPERSGREALVEAALAAQLGAVCADALIACRRLFATPVDDALLAALRANPDEPSAALLDAGRWAWAWSDLWHQDGWGDRMGFAVEVLRNRLKRIGGRRSSTPAETGNDG